MTFFTIFSSINQQNNIKTIVTWIPNQSYPIHLYVSACLQARTGHCRIIHPTHLLKKKKICILLHEFFLKVSAMHKPCHPPWGYIIWMRGGNLWWNFQANSYRFGCIWGHAVPNEWAAALTMFTERCRSTRPQHGYNQQEPGAQETRSLCWRVFEAAMGVNTSKFLEFLLPAPLH